MTRPRPEHELSFWGVAKVHSPSVEIFETVAGRVCKVLCDTRPTFPSDSTQQPCKMQILERDIVSISKLMHTRNR